MICVINISWPRKFIKEKYNGVMLRYKLNPVEVNKYLVFGAVLGVALLIGTNAYAADITGQQEYNHVLNYLVSVKHYPKEYAQNMLTKFSEADFKQMLSFISDEEIGNKQIKALIEVYGSIAHPIKFTKETIQYCIEFFSFLK